MKIHEFQAKEILREAGVAVPRGIVARTADEAADAFRAIGRADRGRQSPDSRRRPRQGDDQGQSAAARRATGRIGRRSRRGRRQTCSANRWSRFKPAPTDRPFARCWSKKGCDIARELYLGIVVDRAAAGPVLMVSSEGGMNIEDVAAKTPELIFGAVSIPTPACRASRPASWRRGWGSRAPASARPRSSCKRSAGCSSPSDCSLARDQSAGRDRRRRTAGARRQDDASTTTPCSATRTWPSCAIWPKKSRPKCGPARPG